MRADSAAPATSVVFPAPDFQQALTGTIAYDYAAALQAKAQAHGSCMPAPGAAEQDGATFQPINPDGSLGELRPPPCLSPTGPIAYLQEMLNLRRLRPAPTPFAAPAKGQSSLGDTVAARRGPVGNLLASCANLETPLLDDRYRQRVPGVSRHGARETGRLRNGLRYVGRRVGRVRALRRRRCTQKRTDAHCHEPVAIYAALPEYSTPATPIAKNQAVEPLVYNNLKADFSSCDLPYSQALDVSRTYLQHFGSCRFEEMRTFRKCITEFALDPINPPAGFQSFLRRYPVRIDIAIEYLGHYAGRIHHALPGSVPQACGQQTGDSAPQLPGQGPAPTFGFSPRQLRGDLRQRRDRAARLSGRHVSELLRIRGIVEVRHSDHPGRHAR